MPAATGSGGFANSVTARARHDSLIDCGYVSRGGAAGKRGRDVTSYCKRYFRFENFIFRQEIMSYPKQVISGLII